MKNNTKQGAKPKGFGFADAMFGMRDLAAEYGGIQPQDYKKEEQNVPSNPQGLKNKNNQSLKNTNKVTVVKKQAIGSRPNQVKIESSAQKHPEVFKLQPGKEHVDISSVQLIPMQTGKHVYELTTDGTISHWEYNEFCDTGKQANEIVPDPQVSFNFQATDVRQGGLGNCYLVATMASLAHVPMVLRERIPDFKAYSGKTKSFRVNLFESGKSVQIPVDNVFPKVFVKPVENDISLMILEKAYAQAYGNYSVLNMGHACDSLRDLTGAPTEYIDLKDEQMLKYKIKEAFQNKFALAIATKANIAMEELSQKHSYNILDFKITSENKLHLKVRDPRGCSYSQFPNSLPNISQEESCNGIFWANYHTIRQNFQVITSCKVRYGNNYYYKTFKAKQLVENQGSIVMKVGEPIQATITVHQKHKKHFDEKFKYGMIKVMVSEINRNGQKLSPLRTIAAEFKVQQVCVIEAHLEPGSYLIMAQACSPNSKPKVIEEAMTLSVYSSNTRPESLQFQMMKGKILPQPFLMEYIKRNKAEFRQTVSDKKLERYAGPLYGYLCMYYNNKSGKQVSEELTYDVENVTTRDKKVVLKPGEEKIIIHPIGQANNCSHKFSFKTKTLYKS